MAELIRPHAERHPAATAVSDEVGALTWAELDERVDRWIALLLGAGLVSGDRVAFVTGNGRGTVEALLACLHAGLVAVPVNWHLTPAETAYLLADSGARAVVADREHAVTAAAAGLPGPGLVFGGEPCAGLAAAEPLLAAAGGGERGGRCQGSIMFYTSGTTGRPAGVVAAIFEQGGPLSRLDALLRALVPRLGLPERGRNLLVGPWYHSAQLFFSVFPLLAGCELVMRRRFDPEDFLALVGDSGVTHTHLVPTHFVRLLRLDATVRGRFRGGSLRRVWHGGGPCSVDVKRQMIAWWGPVLVEYYGATEGGIATLADSAEWLARPCTVGRPVPPGELLVVNDRGLRAGPGEVGLVYLRRDDGRDFSYHHAPEKTRAAHLGPGVYTYGDIGWVDADGYLFLTGRAHDTIVSGGVNVYPAEVEAALLAHPAVRDAAVFGEPDDEYGERVCAAVELDESRLAPGAAPAALERHCREQLAGFKTPRTWHVVSSVPRGPTGKVRAGDVRDACARTAARG
jgi:acyl-CoA synthetase (AMP-forming)/AMP-acid ligase II